MAMLERSCAAATEQLQAAHVVLMERVGAVQEGVGGLEDRVGALEDGCTAMASKVQSAHMSVLERVGALEASGREAGQKLPAVLDRLEGLEGSCREGAGKLPALMERVARLEGAGDAAAAVREGVSAVVRADELQRIKVRGARGGRFRVGPGDGVEGREKGGGRKGRWHRGVGK